MTQPSTQQTIAFAGYQRLHLGQLKLAAWVKIASALTHCAYLFANRMKVLVHDGLGIWLAARRLHQGKFTWPGTRHGSQMKLSAEQLHALILGLPWQRVGPGNAISIL